MIDTAWILMPPSASRDAVQSAFWQYGSVPLVFDQAAEALDQLNTQTPKVLVFSDEPPGFCRHLIRVLQGTPVTTIVVIDAETGFQDWQWLSTGADDFLLAPLTVQSAVRGLQRHLTQGPVSERPRQKTVSP